MTKPKTKKTATAATPADNPGMHPGRDLRPLFQGPQGQDQDKRHPGFQKAGQQAPGVQGLEEGTKDRKLRATP